MKHANRIKTGTVIIALLTISVSALADHPGGRLHQSKTENFSVKVSVIDAEPLIRIVEVTTPQEVCWNEQVTHRDTGYKSHTPQVLGGIIGGVVGNTMGGGRGKSIMTVAGAILGASIGRDIRQQNQSYPQKVITHERVCEIEQITYEEERADGYRVTYEYDGREFVTYMQDDPGEYIRIRVHVEPLAYNDLAPRARTGRAKSHWNHYKS